MRRRLQILCGLAGWDVGRITYGVLKLIRLQGMPIAALPLEAGTRLLACSMPLLPLWSEGERMRKMSLVVWSLCIAYPIVSLVNYLIRMPGNDGIDSYVYRICVLFIWIALAYAHLRAIGVLKHRPLVALL